MKRKITVLFILCLLLMSAPTALAAEQGVPGIPGGGSGSLNELFAQMQQELADQMKSGTAGYLDGLRESQEQQKETAGYLDQVRQLQTQEAGGGPTPELPAELKDYMDQNGLSYGDGTDLETVANSLQEHQEKLGTDVQSQMGGLQDFLGGYNSSPSSGLQGLSSTAQGQSLFSAEGGTAMDLPPIAASLLIGTLLGMALMWGIQRRRGRGRDA